MEKQIIIFLLIGLNLLSCTDSWESRFNEGPSEKTVFELINENQEYSVFATLLKETGYDSVLQRSGVYTVLIPPEASLLTLIDLGQESKVNSIAFHISNSIVYSSDVQDIIPLKTISGKQLYFEKKDGEIILNQETNILNADIRAENGVIHEISDLLVIRPNLTELIESDNQFSYIRDFILEGTELVFDEENSVQIGIDSIGRNLYDSVWISSNEFFARYANLSSEDKSFTIFIADNMTLDTAQSGELKQGYLTTLPSYILEGINYLEDIDEQTVTVTGRNFSVTPGDAHLYAYASNGLIYKLNGLAGLPIPESFIWEFTDVSDFDSIRGASTTDYLNHLDQLSEIQINELDGGFTEFKYEMKGGTYNNDYLKIKTIPRTDASIEFLLPNILPAKYRIYINATIRVADGIKYDAYLNDDLISTGNNFNEGLYKFETREIGDVEITVETGNVFKLLIDGSSSITVFSYIDYLRFEPIK